MTDTNEGTAKEQQKINAFSATQEAIILAFRTNDEILTQIVLSRRINSFYQTVHKGILSLEEQGIIIFLPVNGGRKKPLKLTDKGVQLWISLNKIKKLMK